MNHKCTQELVHSSLTCTDVEPNIAPDGSWTSMFWWGSVLPVGSRQIIAVLNQLQPARRCQPQPQHGTLYQQRLRSVTPPLYGTILSAEQLHNWFVGQTIFRQDPSLKTGGAASDTVPGCDIHTLRHSRWFGFYLLRFFFFYWKIHFVLLWSFSTIFT